MSATGSSAVYYRSTSSAESNENMSLSCTHFSLNKLKQVFPSPGMCVMAAATSDPTRDVIGQKTTTTWLSCTFLVVSTVTVVHL